MKYHNISACSIFLGLCSLNAYGMAPAHRVDRAAPSQTGLLSSIADALGSVADVAKRSANKAAYGDPDIYLADKIRSASLIDLPVDERRQLINDGLRAWISKINDTCTVLERRRDRETFITTALLAQPELLSQVSPDLLVEGKRVAHVLTTIAQQVEEQFTNLLDQQSKNSQQAIDKSDG